MKVKTILESHVSEKWGKSTDTPKSERGKYKGKTKEELRKMLSALKKSGPHKEGSAEYEKQNELEFALRAKSGWGKVDESRYDDYMDRFVKFLEIKWQEDYLSVYDVLDGHMEDDDWVEQAQALAGDEDIEDLKMYRGDIKKFMGMAIDGAKLSPNAGEAIKTYAVTWDDFEDSEDAKEYEEDFRDAEEYRRDPYGYHGVRRSDFY